MPRRLSYALAGAMLSVGAPLGLLAVRLALGGADRPWLQQVARAVSEDLVAYVYTAASTGIAFSLFGYLLGRQADRLADLSETDALTGLYNARGLSHHLGTAMARTKRYDVPLALVLVDIDGMKHINDSEGHAAGDEALRAVSAAIRAELRETDAAARWGGDEFAILAPNISKPGALALAERVRASIAAGGHASGRVTASLGVVVLLGADTCKRIDTATLTRSADAALYDAKQHGGNRVAIREAVSPIAPVPTDPI